MASGSLHDHKVVLITDNSSFEGAYYKGHSPSKQLSEILFRVHKAESTDLRDHTCNRPNVVGKDKDYC